MRLPHRRLAVGIVGPALSLSLLAGCGGSGDSPSADSSAGADTLQPVSLVRSSAEATQEAGSAKIELSSETTVGGQTVAFTGAGAFDAAAQRGTFDLEVPAAGGRIEQRIVDDMIYLSLPQEPGVFYSLKLSDVAGTALGGSTDPTAGFQSLKAASDDVEEVGTETIRDVETTHYTGTFDVAEAIEQAQGPTKSVLESTLGTAGLESVPFEVYLDDEGRVRRFVQTLELPASEQTQGQPLTSRTSVDVFDFGTTVEVEPPPADKVKDGAPLLQALQGAAGGPTG